MARTVQVVLKQDVNNLGTSGEVVKVRPGYARNYLIPRGMAVIATRDNIRVIEHEKQLALARFEQKQKAAAEAAKIFAGLELHVAKEVADPEEGKLLGSVTVQDVMEALERKGFGDKVDKKQIEMPEDHIKFTGSYEIKIVLMKGVDVPVKLEVKTAA